ncbi:MAG: GNAT family N-acetyltransferase [Caulobacter sp.]|nr:GNAT family N-acetyltransferase [Caulobacter sp.]
MPAAASLRIRVARPDELATCAALYETVGREVFTWWPVAEIQASAMMAAFEEEAVHVALLDGEIVGFASLYRPDSFLHSLYLAASARGRGVGSALLDHVAKQAVGPLSLKVQKLNTPAIAFYQRRGFRTVDDGGAEEPGGGWFRMRRDGPAHCGDNKR